MLRLVEVNSNLDGKSGEVEINRGSTEGGGFEPRVCFR